MNLRKVVGTGAAFIAGAGCCGLLMGLAVDAAPIDGPPPVEVKYAGDVSVEYATDTLHHMAPEDRTVRLESGATFDDAVSACYDTWPGDTGIEYRLWADCFDAALTTWCEIDPMTDAACIDVEATLLAGKQ